MLDAHGITCSMSRRGDCYDNAVMEAFFSSLKSELADRFPSCGEAKMELFDYIECSITSAAGTRRSAMSARRSSSDARLWTPPSPWTPKSRPPGLGKPHRARFPTARTAPLRSRRRTHSRTAID